MQASAAQLARTAPEQSKTLTACAQDVAACIARALALGYAKPTLWTNDILASARRIYQAAGFLPVNEEKHRSFGHDPVGQTRDLVLSASRTSGDASRAGARGYLPDNAKRNR